MALKRIKDPVAVANKYAKDVVSGKIIACKWTKLACKRQLDDLKPRSKVRRLGYKFDKDRARHVVDFFQDHCQHVDSGNMGEPFILATWQVFVLTTVFGWLSPDGSRRFHTVYESCGKKNGKSTRQGGLANYLAFFDTEAGAEVYCVANSFDQAGRIFDPARKMALMNSDLSDGREIRVKSILDLKDFSVIRPLHSKGSTNDGVKPHASLVDEYHEFPNNDLVSRLQYGAAARPNHITWFTTTAGSKTAGPCYQEEQYLKKILDGLIENNAYFGIIYTLDEDDDWEDEKSWFKANPSLNISVPLKTIREELARAKGDEGKKSDFKRFRANQWVGASFPYFSIDLWKKLADPKMRMEDFSDWDCYAGIDLAETDDFTALAILFKKDIPGKIEIEIPRAPEDLYDIPETDDDLMEIVEFPNAEYRLFTRFFYPYDSAKQKQTQMGQPLLDWAAQGFIDINDGNVVDYANIYRAILALRKFSLIEVAIDYHWARFFESALMAKDIAITEMKQDRHTMSPPTKYFKEMMNRGQIHHDGNPCMDWMISNVTVKEYGKTVLPQKEDNSRENKIDGPVAAIMALERAMTAIPAPPSVYDQGQGVESWG